MAQVPNLLDLFRNGRQDAQAKAKPADAGTAPKGGRNAGNLLPIEAAPAAKGNLDVTRHASAFQAKVEKSRAKLAAKERPAHVAGHEAARPEAPAARTEPARKAEPAARADKSQRPARPSRPGRDGAHDAPDAQPAARTDAARASAPKDDREDDRPDGLDEKTTAAIKKGLHDLGIEVDDEQLNDPAFLADIMRLLQSLQVQAPADEGAQDVAATAAAPAATDAGNAPEAAAPAVDPRSTPSQEQAPVAAEKPREEAKPVTRKELARLLEGRIAGLQKATAPQEGAVRVSPQAPAVTPKEWQGIQVRARAEGPSPDPLPLADLDRLRVMQAAAAQAGNAQAETPQAGGDFAIETDASEPVSGAASAAASEAGKDPSQAGDQDAQTDLFGRNGDQTNGAEASARKDGPLAAKEGATGPQFHQALEQARGIEHRPGSQHAAEPRMLAREAGVLEQIARKMAATAHKAGETVSIQLTPENLGKVHVSLEMKEGAMAARIAVENDDARRQVESNLDALKDALKDQGIKLQGLEVSVDQRHASLFNPDGSSSESFFRRQGRGGEQGEGGRAGEPAPFEAAPESDTGRRWGYNTMEYIG
jgi:flagellar hook-length control protein FliK